MQSPSDAELLAEYATRRSEAAFARLVERYVALVHSAARRQVSDPHLAEEITQAVFILLARKAGSLGRQTVLAGWLCRTAHFAARDALRTDRRRRHREQLAAHMDTTPDAAWQQLAPLLDEAVAQLREADRNAIVLRYYEQRSLEETGAALGIGADAAQKRVARALEKLRAIFSKRGVTLTGAAIAGAVSANAILAVPAGLAVSVTATVAEGALVGGSTLAVVNGVMKIMAWTNAKVAAVAGFAVLTAAAVIFLQAKKVETEPRSSAVPESTTWRLEAVDSEQPRQKVPSMPVAKYVLEDLGTMPGSISSHATGVNNLGQVVGWVDGTNGDVHAFVWDQGSMTDLGTLGGSKAIAAGINDLGEIVAVVLTNGERRVFIMQGTNVTDLGAIDGFAKLGTEGNISYVPSVDINNLSQVTGRLTVNGDSQRSFLFSQGQMSYFGLRGDGTICYAKAMNNRGQIAGQSIQRDSGWGVFLWQDGEISDLKTLGGPRASVNAMNDHGTVVGWANPAGAAWDQAHAIVWEKGELLDLNVAGWKTSRATSINNAGEIVGNATTTENRSFAFLKRGDEILDLNDFIDTNSGWQLFDASEINNRGQILARGRKGGQWLTVLLSPSSLSGVLPGRPVVASIPTRSSTAAAPGVNLTSLERLPDGTFRLAFRGEPGARYAVEASANLTTWIRLGVARNNNGQVEFIDQDAAKFALRFYRAVRAP